MVDANFIFFNFLFFCYQKKRSVKLDKVMEGQWKITSRFRANARKLILGSIGTPLDHLSVKKLNLRLVCMNVSGEISTL